VALSKIKTLEEQVLVDELTKVRNRTGYDQAMAHEVSQLPNSRDSRKAPSVRVGLLIIDIDHFKSVNDTFGHPVGDMVLVAIVQVIIASVRIYDYICRWGGDELVIILPGINEFGLEKVGEKIRLAVEKLTFEELSDLEITVTIGGAVQLHQSDQKLFSRADAALIKAKKSGRNRVLMTNEV
jgi:diguanylate cyclase (GGDEF)-like protein